MSIPNPLTKHGWEYMQFIVSEKLAAIRQTRQQRIESEPYMTARRAILSANVSLEAMDYAVARSNGEPTYDNIVGTAWQQFGQDRPQIALALLEIAGLDPSAQEPGK